MQVSLKEIVEKTKSDTVSFITAVHAQPVIWDSSRTRQDFDSKLARRVAWDNILQDRIEGYHTMTQLEKDECRRRAMAKWKSIRDCYAHSLKSPRPHKYIYSTYLYFLNKDLYFESPLSALADKSTDAQKDSDDSQDKSSRIQITTQGKNIIVNSDSVIEHDIMLDDDHSSQFEDNLEEWELNVNNIVDKHTLEDDSVSKDSSVQLNSRPNKRVRQTSTEENTSLQNDVPSKEKKIASESNWGRDSVEILASILEREEDDDKSFFNSLVPLVKSLSENSRMEFKIEAWKLLKEITDQNSKETT